MLKIANNLQQLVEKQAFFPTEPLFPPIITVGGALDTLNPTGNQLGDYGIYGGVGALGGAGIGALVELLRNKEEKNYLKSMLIGGGIGGGLGLGAKALGDNYMKDNKAIIDEQLAKMTAGKDAPWYRLDKKVVGALAGNAANRNRAMGLGSESKSIMDSELNPFDLF